MNCGRRLNKIYHLASNVSRSSCVNWCMEFTIVSARRTWRMRFSRDYVDTRKTIWSAATTNYRPTHFVNLCDSKTADQVWRAASVCSHTLALLLGIDFQKLSARHKHNHTSRNFFYKTSYFRVFMTVTKRCNVYCSIVCCKWTRNEVIEGGDVRKSYSDVLIWLNQVDLV